MVFDFIKKLGGKKRPRGDGGNTVIGQLAAAAPAPAAEPEAVAVATPPPRAAAARADIPRDAIARRAYEIWVRKGRPSGTADQDWLEAEAELRAELPSRPRSDVRPTKPR